MSIAIGIVRPIVTVPHGTRLERVDDDQREHGDSTIMMPSTATSAVNAGDGPDLLFRHLAQRLAVAADGRTQDDHVLHRAAEHDADDDPEHAGQIAELGGERRTDERAGPAMAAKWWPNTTHRFVGTKSRPSFSRSAGVGRASSSAKMRAAMNAL